MLQLIGHFSFQKRRKRGARITESLSLDPLEQFVSVEKDDVGHLRHQLGLDPFELPGQPTADQVATRRKGGPDTSVRPES